MPAKTATTTLLRGSVNTLAYSETNNSTEPPILVNGKGSDLQNTKAIKGRAKRKAVTQVMALSLIDVAKQKGFDDWQKSLWNTYYCQSKIHTANGRIYGKYCKNKFCSLCSAIRKADILNRYLPVIQKWQEPYFVTLTIKAYPKQYLKKAIQKILDGFRLIVAKHKKRHQRGKGIKLVGIKSLESNFNPIKKTYNPHLHIIVENKEMAELLVSEWLQIFTSKYTNRKGQDMIAITNREKALIEIIKYGSKIFTEPDIAKKRETTQRDIYAAALFNIFVAMKGQRIFDRFGFNLPKNLTTTDKTKLTYLTEYDEWKFDLKSFDWLNSANDERLTDFKPLDTLRNLLENRVNTQAE